MNKQVFERIQSRFTEKGLKFSAKDGIFNFNMVTGDVVGKLAMYIEVFDRYYVSYAVLANNVLPERYATVSEYLHRANFGLLFGNFEIDYSDGEIRFKITTDCEDVKTLTNHIIDRSVALPCAMFERYGEGMLKLMMGIGTPEGLIQESEKIED